MTDWFGSWTIVAPPGLTDTGRIRRFQDRTVQRLNAKAVEISERYLTKLKAGIAETYTEGEGTLLDTVQYQVEQGRDGVQVRFMAGGRHLVFLTALAGEPVASPGHLIPKTGTSRFYWANPLHGLAPGMYRFTPSHQAFWRTRQGRDVLAEVLSAGAQEFAQAMITEHRTALLEFIQNDLQIDSKSPRVNVAAGSGIAPQ